MSVTKAGILALVVLMSTAMVAEATLTLLYDDTHDPQIFGPGANGQRRSQHFSATESLHTLADPSFNSAAFWLGDFGPGESLANSQLGLYPWMGSEAASVAAGAIATMPVNCGEGFADQITLTFAPQPTNQQYFLSLLVGTFTGTNFGLGRMGNGNGGTNNDAFNAGVVKTDREYLVWLNGVPEPATLSLLALGLPLVLRRRR